MSTDAREKARQIAAQQAKKSPSQASRRWLQFGVLAVVLIIVGIIGFVVVNGNKNTKVAESGPVPSSANEYGGIVLTKDGIVQNSSTQETRDFKQLATSTSSVTPMVNEPQQQSTPCPRACRPLKRHPRTASPYA